MTPIESNKQVVKQYVKAFNAGDMKTLRDLFTTDALVYGVLGWGPIEAVIPIWEELHKAFAIELIVEEMIAEGDTVAVRYSELGIFTNPFRGKQPTGKSYELVAMEWFSFRHHHIARRWGARDSASQAKQLGL
jgi:hypothetical protein